MCPGFEPLGLDALDRFRIGLSDGRHIIPLIASNAVNQLVLARRISVLSLLRLDEYFHGQVVTHVPFTSPEWPLGKK